MTKEEAEQLFLAYREIDDDTGEEYGFRITKYLGKHLTTHYFECVLSDIENPNPDDYGIYGVSPNGDVFCAPIS